MVCFFSLECHALYTDDEFILYWQIAKKSNTTERLLVHLKVTWSIFDKIDFFKMARQTWVHLIQVQIIFQGFTNND